MRQSVSQSYPQLWHYTTAPGLHGILTSQQLWATNIFYLNDGEEFTGFFDRKLLHLLKKGVQDGISKARRTKEGLSVIDAAGGPEVLEKELPTQLLTSLRAATLGLDVYVTSFCYTRPGLDSEDGLLSQWRGYGPDGGYAIVFDTQGLEELLRDEVSKFLYSFSHCGDVDYHDGDATAEPAHEETVDWETAIRETIGRIIVERNLSAHAEKLFEPVMSLSTRHKHRGFREESEVRIAVAPSREVIEEARKACDTCIRKPVYFTPRGGILVPHIALFERQAGKKATLPIKRIIVGPHPDKLKRKEAIELLLDQCRIEAEVAVSDIPYLGR